MTNKGVNFQLPIGGQSSASVDTGFTLSGLVVLWRYR